MSEENVIKDEQLARAQLVVVQYWFVWRPSGEALGVAVQIGLRSAAVAVHQVQKNIFFIVMMRFSDNVGIGAEKIYTESSLFLAPVWRDKMKECLNQLFGLRVFKDFNAFVFA